MKSSKIFEITLRYLFWPILLFGLSMIFFGHLSPGGGFQGGAILSSGIILLCLAKRKQSVKETFLRALKDVGMLFFLLSGLAGILFHGYFLKNILPLGKSGQLISGGFIFPLNLLIGLMVCAGFVLIFYNLWEE